MPETTTLHSGFTVASAQRTAAFFHDCLGFAVSEPRRTLPGVLDRIVGVPGAVADIVYVTAPGHVIELLEYRHPASATAAAPRPCDVGFAHLAFLVADVDATVAEAAAFGFAPAGGVATIPAGPNAGRKAVYLRDAFGFTIELMGG